MPIDPRISLGVQQLQLPDPLARYGQVQNILAAQSQLRGAETQQQTAALQQEKAQMELAGFRRRQAGLEKFLAASAKGGKTGSPEEVANGFYDFALTQEDPQLILAAQTMRQAAMERKEYLTSKQPPKIPPVGPAYGALGSGTFSMNQNMPSTLGSGTFDFGQQIAPVLQPNVPGVAVSTPVKPATSIAAMTAPPVANQLAPASIMTAPANQLAPAPVNQTGADTTALENKINDLRTKYPNVPQAQKEADRLEKQLDELNKTAPDAMLMRQLGYPLTQAGYQAFRDAQRQDRLLNPQEEGQKIRIALASRPPPQPPQPPQPQPPVAVIGPNGKPIYVSREDAIRKGMTPASAMEGLAPKEIQAREAKFPAATSAIKTFESSADRLAKDLETLANHPGLSGISGLLYGRTPAVTKEARAAQALYDSIVARGGFQELQNMRSASPTGGALGNVSNQEGQYLRDAFAPINRTQDTADLSRSLREAAGATRASKQRLREAYDMTYDYKNQGESPAPAASSGGKVVDFGSLR